jgi:hypothetical protein
MTDQTDHPSSPLFMRLRRKETDLVLIDQTDHPSSPLFMRLRREHE